MDWRVVQVSARFQGRLNKLWHRARHALGVVRKDILPENVHIVALGLVLCVENMVTRRWIALSSRKENRNGKKTTIV